MIQIDPRTFIIKNIDTGEIISEIENAKLEMASESDAYNQSEPVISIKNLEDSFAAVAKALKDAIIAITRVKNIILEVCPNKRIIYLATHAKKYRTRKKNLHRAFRILEEIE